jgi:hypothetical protein
MDDPLSLLMQGIWLLAAGMYPLGVMLGATCSPCCQDCDRCVFDPGGGNVPPSWIPPPSLQAVYVEIEGQAWTVTSNNPSSALFNDINLCDSSVPSISKDIRYAIAYFECISSTEVRVIVRVVWESFNFSSPFCSGRCEKRYVYSLDICDPGLEAVLVSEDTILGTTDGCCKCTVANSPGLPDLPCPDVSKCYTTCCDFSGSTPSYVGFNPLP